MKLGMVHREKLRPTTKKPHTIIRCDTIQYNLPLTQKRKYTKTENKNTTQMFHAITLSHRVRDRESNPLTQNTIDVNQQRPYVPPMISFTSALNKGQGLLQDQGAGKTIQLTFKTRKPREAEY